MSVRRQTSEDGSVRRQTSEDGSVRRQASDEGSVRRQASDAGSVRRQASDAGSVRSGSPRRVQRQISSKSDDDGRIPLYSEYRGPGAGAYKLSGTIGYGMTDVSLRRAPSYSLSWRNKELQDRVPSPKYFIEDVLTHRGRQEKQGTKLNSRAKAKEIEASPGPSSYDQPSFSTFGRLSRERTSPQIRIKTRDRYEFKNFAPPATRYTIRAPFGCNVPDFRRAPTALFGVNTPVGSSSYVEIKKATPSPNKYNSNTSPDATRKRSAMFSMAGRTLIPDYDTRYSNPAPGRYFTSLRKDQRGGNMGIRHSAFTMPMLTPADCY